MTERAQQMLREALALPVDQRADIAADLLASLDETPAMGPDVVQAAWAREIERRARRVMPANHTANRGRTCVRALPGGWPNDDTPDPP